MTKEERKERRAKDKALYRGLATQLLLLAISDSGKAERYLAAADACDQCAARLRERAAET